MESVCRGGFSGGDRYGGFGVVSIFLAEEESILWWEDGDQGGGGG